MGRGDRQGCLSDLSIADGKKRFDGFQFVFMEIRSVIEKRCSPRREAAKKTCRPGDRRRQARMPVVPGPDIANTGTAIIQKRIRLYVPNYGAQAVSGIECKGCEEFHA